MGNESNYLNQAYSAWSIIQDQHSQHFSPQLNKFLPSNQHYYQEINFYDPRFMIPVYTWVPSEPLNYDQ